MFPRSILLRNWTSNFAQIEIEVFLDTPTIRFLQLPPSHKLEIGIKLINITLFALNLVLMAGDFSLNPGSIKDPCVLCTKGCRLNQEADSL